MVTRSIGVTFPRRAWERGKSRHTVLFVAVFESGPQLCFGFWTGDGADWKDQTDYDRTGEYRDIYTTTHWMPLPELAP